MNVKFPGLLTLCRLQVGTEVWKEGSATFFRVNQSKSVLLGYVWFSYITDDRLFTAGRILLLSLYVVITTNGWVGVEICNRLEGQQ